ncbi:MAG: hypothetical protein WCJ61_11595 [Paludibacter sp.]
MKKKNVKNIVGTAVEVVSNLKTIEESSPEKEQDALVIKSIETSVRKIEKLKKEVLALKEKLRNKKIDLNQEKEIMWELVQAAKKTLKSNPPKKEKAVKKGKKHKAEKVEQVEQVEQIEQIENPVETT